MFLSHVAEEAPLAGVLKSELEHAIPGASVFVSTVDIGLGQPWLEAVDTALGKARAILVLCSRRSTRKPWVNFESGAGWSGGDRPVIPLCHGGLTKETLPLPLSIFQAHELTSSADCALLAQRVAEILGLHVAGVFDATSMASSLSRAPPRGSEVGIALMHGQDRWESGPRSLFALPTSPQLGLDGKWSLRPLSRAADVMPASLAPLSGLIYATPWRDRIDEDEVETIVDWVRAGGRLLLLGFELGDRHHDANLGELSRHFGVHGETDIVGPPSFSGAKPYDVPVDLNVAHGDPHPLTNGLAMIRLANVQTLRVEPGGIEWLRVGDNSVCRPAASAVQYHEGTLSQPFGSEFDHNDQAGWLPAAVEAPSGLCGRGGVQMIGTWDLIGRRSAFVGDNPTLVARLLDWLSGKDVE